MGCNFYIEHEEIRINLVTKKIRIVKKDKHIGKQSMGWRFCFYKKPSTWWFPYLSKMIKKGYLIKDENGSQLSFYEFRKFISDSSRIDESKYKDLDYIIEDNGFCYSESKFS